MISFSAFIRLSQKGYLRRDIRNILTYGYAAAPRSFERIWIDPSSVNEAITVPFTREQSALVIDPKKMS